MPKAISFTGESFAKGMHRKPFPGATSYQEKPTAPLTWSTVTLEPDAGVGFIGQDGTLVIYASTQNPTYDLKEDFTKSSDLRKST